MRQISACWFLALFLLLFGSGTAGAGEFDFGDFGLDSSSSGGFSLVGSQPKELLTATLTPETGVLVPGKPLVVMLTLKHADGHYSYWQNPGGPGTGTAIAWDLPDGYTVSAPAWPAPQRYVNGTITSYIYKGTVDALFTITPPAELAAGEDVTIAGELTAQACTARSCNPIRQAVKLTLKAAGADAEADAAGEADPDIAFVRDTLPATPRGWRFDVAEYRNELLIGMYPAIGSIPELADVYFFDATRPEPVVDSQRPQTLEKEGGVWWLRVPLREGPSRIGTRLQGILIAPNGWLEDSNGPRAFAIDLPVEAEGEGRPSGLQRAVGQQTVVLLFFAFMGGLLLNVMPCVFPVIGLKIMGFAKQAHKDRRAVFLHGLAYAAGVLICFWTLSFLVITMGRGWGAQLQSDWFMFALCHIFMIMSMNMAGVFDIGTSVAGAGNALSGREGIKRSFFTGLLATITSTPCSAPFLGTALAYALSLPPLMSLGVFTLMGLGFAFPYLALSLFPNWLKKLPKPGPWMDTFRQAMCFPLFATTAYLFWTMEAMLEEWQFLMLLFGLVLTAMACWLYGKHQHTGLKRPTASRILFGCAVVSLAAGLWLGMPRGATELKWMEWSPETVSRLREEGRPVYVDFTARWCATCQLNKHVYQDSGIVELVRNKNVALLKADWTQYDERITSTLKNEFNKAAVPVTVLYAPGEGEGEVLPDLLTVGNVTEAMRELPDWVLTKR